MFQTTNQIREIRHFKAPPVCSFFCELPPTSPEQGFRKGYDKESLGWAPLRLWSWSIWGYPAVVEHGCGKWPINR